MSNSPYPLGIKIVANSYLQKDTIVVHPEMLEAIKAVIANAAKVKDNE